MIKLELDIQMPEACVGCFLLDDEFEYCHGHLVNDCTELRPYLRTIPYTKPEWCPLIEVKKEKLEYNMVNNRLNSKEISDFSPTGAKVY